MPRISKILAISLALLSPVSAQAEDSAATLSPIPQVSQGWRFEVTPYLWSPSINSSLFFNDQYKNTSKFSSGDVLSNLKSGGMISAEAHYGNWGVMGDLVSATLQETPNIKITLQQTILTGAATYTILSNKDAYIDGLLGVRSIAATATVTGSSANLGGSGSVSTIDPIAGFKGRYRIADSTWYVPFYADIGGGAGTTNITWQTILGVGKTIENWVDISLSYRYLYYDMTGSSVLQKTTFKGPQLAATFNF